MRKIIAIGPREQDFQFTNGLFDGSITLYGRGTEKNRSYCSANQTRINHNITTDEQNSYIINEAEKLIEEDPEIRFMSYDPNAAFDCGERIISRTLCLNRKSLMDRLKSKIRFKEWASDTVEILPYTVMYGRECSLDTIVERVGLAEKYVFQKEVSSGGEDTVLLEKSEIESHVLSLEDGNQYLISRYMENSISINIHVIIYDEEILLTPVSVQITTIRNRRILYRGADFIAADQIDSGIMERFREKTFCLCRKLQSEGFRGIAGLDGLIVDGQVFFVEINNRFQGSSPLINLALHDHGLPCLQELNLRAFEESRSGVDISSLSVPYSCYTYISDENGKIPVGYPYDLLRDNNVVSVNNDGLDLSWSIYPLASLDRVVFKTKIVSISAENTLLIHPNIMEADPKWYRKIAIEHDPLYLKIALINQGLFISSEAEKYLRQNGGIRSGVFNAVDLDVHGIVINSAVRVKFARLSPFSLEPEGDHLVLRYYGDKVTDVGFYPADELQDIRISHDTKMSDICLLATDRVRIQHSSNCYFKHNGMGCRFCEVQDYDYSFDLGQVESAVQTYMDSAHQYRHYLIGGRSDSPEKEPASVLRIAQYITAHQPAPIYVMCVPPRNFEVFETWANAGVTEIAMNLEIWDSCLAKKWMPGKGAISREYYLKALEAAVKVWGKTGKVRSAFVVGLEPDASLLEGIRSVCRCGAAPILSVFRPIPGTPAHYVIPYDNERLLSIYLKAHEICAEYGLKPGPSCVPCQNNTLSMPDDYCG